MSDLSDSSKAGASSELVERDNDESTESLGVRTGTKGSDQMNGKRILGIVCAGILASSLSGLVACSANTDKEVPTSQAVQAATVSISMVDAKGNKVTGSGVLIAPRLVLTSGHLISGMSKWSVTNGKTTVTGSRGHTYDWLAYTDKKAHPRKHDVGVITLDEAIKLDTYPRIAASKSADGTKATRVRGTGGGAFEMKDTVLGRINTSPNAYLADIGGETLDTGGAVFDERGIIGIVSGKGMTTGKLYIARTDRLTKWLSPKVSCAGGSLQTRTYAEAQKDKSQAVCEDDAKNAPAPGGNNNGGGSATVPGNGPSANGPLGGGESCAAAEINGFCSGNCVGNFPGGANVPGANGGPSAATNESNGANPNPNGGAGSGSANGANGGTNGANGGSSANNGESNGANPSGGANTGSSANNGESNGANPNGGGGAAGGGSAGAGSESNGAIGGGGAGAGSVSNTPGSGLEPDAEEGCQGASDNPDLCPFDGDLTTFGLNPDQGGGRPDWDIDYTLPPVYGGSAGGGSGGDGLKVN